METQLLFEICQMLNDIRVTKPLVHHITNYVTVCDCANITLAIGASPIMADDLGEAADIAAISSALVLNIGTLNARTIESMLAAGTKANEAGVPVVLDPVGAGASTLRNRTTQTLLDRVRFRVIRGNMSEIRYIAGLGATVKGVDASEADFTGDSRADAGIAKALAAKYDCVVAVTGATDIIAARDGAVCLENGHPMLSTVSGTGCMCSSLVGSFCGVAKNFHSAAAAGVLCMSIAGETAFERAGGLGPGSFHAALFDEIAKINPETILERAKIHEA